MPEYRRPIYTVSYKGRVPENTREQVTARHIKLDRRVLHINSRTRQFETLEQLVIEVPTYHGNIEGRGVYLVRLTGSEIFAFLRDVGISQENAEKGAVSHAWVIVKRNNTGPTGIYLAVTKPETYNEE